MFLKFKFFCLWNAAHPLCRVSWGSRTDSKVSPREFNFLRGETRKVQKKKKSVAIFLISSHICNYKRVRLTRNRGEGFFFFFWRSAPPHLLLLISVGLDSIWSATGRNRASFFEDYLRGVRQMVDHWSSQITLAVHAQMNGLLLSPWIRVPRNGLPFSPYWRRCQGLTKTRAGEKVQVNLGFMPGGGGRSSRKEITVSRLSIFPVACSWRMSRHYFAPKDSSYLYKVLWTLLLEKQSFRSQGPLAISAALCTFFLSTKASKNRKIV